jgi:hypothetical protein
MRAVDIGSAASGQDQGVARHQIALLRRLDERVVDLDGVALLSEDPDDRGLLRRAVDIVLVRAHVEVPVTRQPAVLEDERVAPGDAELVERLEQSSIVLVVGQRTSGAADTQTHGEQANTQLHRHLPFGVPRCRRVRDGPKNGARC